MTRDEAIIMMVDSNLQRSVILPSEKAFSYKMKLEAMKRQGERTDLTCVHDEHKLTGMKSVLDAAEVESPVDLERIKLALQGYNYGNGYISWALEKDGGYTKANAIEFSDMMAERLGWSSYGDKEYVNTCSVIIHSLGCLQESEVWIS